MTGYLRTAAVAAASADVLWLITHYQPGELLRDTLATGLFASAAAFIAAWLLSQVRRRQPR